MGRQIVSQLSGSDMLGNAKLVILAATDGAELLLGTVLGEVRGLSYRHNPQDETKPSIALVGPFKFVPADPARDEIWSMRAFIPGAIHDSIVSSLETGGIEARPYKKSPARKEPAIDVALGGVLRLVLEIGVRKTSTAIGYEYVTRTSDRVPLEMNDPLASLSAAAGIKTLAAPPKVAQLAGPEAAAAQAAGKPKAKRAKK